jgi:hypothetical protein
MEKNNKHYIVSQIVDFVPIWTFRDLPTNL